MKKIYEDILDDVGEIKRPDIQLDTDNNVPHPSEYEYAICNFVPENCLENNYADRMEAILETYADDFSFHLAVTERDMDELIDYISESRPKYAEYKQKTFSTNHEKGFGLIEFNASEKNLPIIFFYIFGLCARTCYLLIPDPEDSSVYIVKSDNLGVSFQANKIITGENTMMFESRSLIEQITYFIVKFDFAAENYNYVKQRCRKFIERKINRYRINRKLKE